LLGSSCCIPRKEPTATAVGMLAFIFFPQQDNLQQQQQNLMLPWNLKNMTAQVKKKYETSKTGLSIQNATFCVSKDSKVSYKS
jgi:hypothetical protein